MNFREHSESSTVDSLKFEVQKQEHGFTLIPKAQDDHCIRIAFSGGELIERDDKYICDLEAQTEVDNEVPGLDCAFCPYDVSVDIPASASMHFSVMCDIVPLEACNGNAVQPSPNTLFLITKVLLKYYMRSLTTPMS